VTRSVCETITQILKFGIRVTRSYCETITQNVA
jgi:hypothetical protein